MSLLGKTGTEYPVLVMKSRYLFPRCSVKLPSSFGVLSLSKGDILLFYTPPAFPWNMFRRKSIATLSEVIAVSVENGSSIAEIRGDRRVFIEWRKPRGTAVYREMDDSKYDVSEELSERLRRRAQEFVFLVNVSESDRLIYLMTFMNGINDITDFISHYFIIDMKKTSRLYREINPSKRGARLERYLVSMIARLGEKTGAVT